MHFKSFTSFLAPSIFTIPLVLNKKGLKAQSFKSNDLGLEFLFRHSLCPALGT